MAMTASGDERPTPTTDDEWQQQQPQFFVVVLGTRAGSIHVYVLHVNDATVRKPLIVKRCAHGEVAKNGNHIRDQQDRNIPIFKKIASGGITNKYQKKYQLKKLTA